MKRLHCIVEGHTEEAVFNEVLVPYIYERTGVFMTLSKIKHSGGGMTSYCNIVNEIRNFLKDKDLILTTFFDFYGINKSYNFPRFEELHRYQTPVDKVCFLEQSVLEDLAGKVSHIANFMPYFQLHEFEALLFSSDVGFEFQYDGQILTELKKVIEQFPNPEDINNSPQTAPSKRLISILERYKQKYNKVVDGSSIAKEIGIEKMLSKCPRFKKWVGDIIDKLNE